MCIHINCKAHLLFIQEPCGELQQATVGCAFWLSITIPLLRYNIHHVEEVSRFIDAQWTVAPLVISVALLTNESGQLWSKSVLEITPVHSSLHFIARTFDHAASNQPGSLFPFLCSLSWRNCCCWSIKIQQTVLRETIYPARREKGTWVFQSRLGLVLIRFWRTDGKQRRERNASDADA